MCKQNNKRTNRAVVVIIWFSLFLGCLFGFIFPAEVSADTGSDGVVIRVGFPTQGGLSWKSETGEYGGYTYDYLQEIAQYTGWEYEFVEAPGDVNESLTTMLDMLSNGEIDILGGIVKNEYTQKLWDFPEYGYGFNYTTLGTLEENTTITENNYYGMGSVRIAVYKNAVTTNEKLKAFCQVNNIDYVPVYCEGPWEMIDVLKRKDADLAVGNDLIPVEGIRTVAKFSGAQYYFATGKGNSEILNELNRTILTIQQAKPYFESKLYDRYFSNPSNRIYFSEEEQSFLRSASVIKMGVIENHAPIQYVDKSGEPRGILTDLLKRIESETGLRFLLVPSSGFEEAFRMLDEGELDAVCGIPYDYKLAQKHELIMCNSIFSAQMVLVTGGSQGNTGRQRIGILNRMQEEQNEQSKEWVLFDSVNGCLDAVLAGQVDSASVNLYTSEYMTRTGKYKKLIVIPQADSTNDYCIGIRKPVNPALVSIIGKVINALPQGDLETIVYQNTTSGGETVTISEFVENNPFLVLGFITGLFVLIGICALFVFWFRMKAVKKLAVESQRYQKLSELANEFIFEYDCGKDVISFSDAFSKRFSVPDKILGFSRVMEGTDPVSESLNPDVIGIFRQMVRNNIKDGSEFPCRLPGGEQRWYRNTFRSIQDVSGKVVYIIGKLTDVQEERSEKERLEKELLLDGLTGIYNAKASRSIIGERLLELSQPGALLIIDIDHFKEVNDRLGHYTGDLVLKAFADILAETSGRWDVPGRLGGDEFILFINACTGVHQLASFCEELCGKAKKTYVSDQGGQTRITISIGAALVEKSCDFAELYQAVDKRLYESKTQGRDRFTIMEN